MLQRFGSSSFVEFCGRIALLSKFKVQFLHTWCTCESVSSWHLEKALRTKVLRCQLKTTTCFFPLFVHMKVISGKKFSTIAIGDTSAKKSCSSAEDISVVVSDVKVFWSRLPDSIVSCVWTLEDAWQSEKVSHSSFRTKHSCHSGNFILQNGRLAKRNTLWLREINWTPMHKDLKATKVKSVRQGCLPRMSWVPSSQLNFLVVIIDNGFHAVGVRQLEEQDKQRRQIKLSKSAFFPRTKMMEAK